MAVTSSDFRLLSLAVAAACALVVAPVAQGRPPLGLRFEGGHEALRGGIELISHGALPVIRADVRSYCDRFTICERHVPAEMQQIINGFRIRGLPGGHAGR